MKEKRRVLVWLSWIHDILLFEGIYVFAAAIQNVKGEEIAAVLLKGLFMLFPVILSYVSICRCKKLWTFLIISLAGTWGMQAISSSFLTGGLTAFVFLFRIHVKVKQGEIRRKMKELPNEAGAQEDQEVWEVPTLLDTPRLFHCMIFIFLYLGLVYVQRYLFLKLMLGILAAELCICLAYGYLESLEGFVKKNMSVANLPVNAMWKIGTAILIFGMAGLFLCLFPSMICQEEPLTKIQFDLEYMGGDMMGYYEEYTESDPMMEELMKLKAQTKEPPEWIKKASEILSVLSLIGLSYLLLKMILIKIKKAAESFSDDGDDEIIFLGKEDEENKKERSLLKRIEKERFYSPDRKIRKLYKKLINYHLREKPYGNETPLELEKRVGLYENEKKEVNKIHDIYEKARYGEEPCTAEEVKEFKLARRKLL